MWIARITGLCAAGLTPAALAADLALSHLDPQARTPAETARIGAVTAPATDFTAAEPFEDNPGGAATVPVKPAADAFSQPSANMSFERELDFRLGNGLFRKFWVSAPSSTLASDGLGPLYNARACQRCHLKDGRGHPPAGPSDGAISMVLRISVPAPPGTGIEEYLASLDAPAPTRPDPTYGAQIQDLAIAGYPSEGHVTATLTETQVTLPDGETVTLQHPDYTVRDPGYGPLAPQAMLSPRIAPQMIGLGLLEAVPAADILALEDSNDTNHDGISGRAQVVWSHDRNRPMLGRFGHKAGMATIRDQVAHAFSTDIGISSPLLPGPSGDCTPAQTACLAAPNGANDIRGAEIDEDGVALVTFYSRNLAVPARRDSGDAQVLHGKQVFYESGCTACHHPKFVTDRLPGQPEQSFQLIWPYTDLLLHDMGDGLADGRPESRATGREWRTAPLWGLGLTFQVNGHTRYLHDGRARSLLEAILWHGGEAGAARQKVIEMPKPDRAALIRFLESL